MTPFATYKPWRPFVTTDTNGVKSPVLFPTRTYTVVKFDELLDPETNTTFKVAKHIARNPHWYFHTKFGDSPPQNITHVEYVTEVVKGEPGLDRAVIWDVVRGEAFSPCWEKPIASIDSLSAALTHAVAQKGLEMRDRNGNVVTGMKHATCCTFHPKSK